MLLNVDVKGLEVAAAAYLSQDKVMLAEQRDITFDLHADNQKVFNLPDRLSAKRYIFKMIYGGTAFGFARDPDLDIVSKSEKFWQEVIERTYDKYKGLAKWHKYLVQTVIQDWKIEIPTGRVFSYEPPYDEYKLRPKILNYPVQGFGADVVMLIRLSLWNRIKHLSNKVKLINTVHDSIVIDLPEDMLYNISMVVEKVFEDFPTNFQRVFKQEFNLPLRCEMEFGRDSYNMEKFNAT